MEQTTLSTIEDLVKTTSFYVKFSQSNSAALVRLLDTRNNVDSMYTVVFSAEGSIEVFYNYRRHSFLGIFPRERLKSEVEVNSLQETNKWLGLWVKVGTSTTGVVIQV